MSAIEFRARIESILGHRGMPAERRLVVLAGGATAACSEAELTDYFHLSRDRNVDADALVEVVLQTYLFAGYPRAINALFAYRAAYGDRPVPVEAAPDPSVVRARGEELCRVIYAEHYDPLRRNIAALHPDLDRWMVDEGYGRVLGRPMLDPATRELAAVSALVVQGAARQLRSHLLGAMHAGAPIVEIEESVDQCRVICDEPRWRSAITLTRHMLRLG